MTIIVRLILICSLSGYSQHFDRIPNISRQIVHFEDNAYEIFASDLIFGSPDKSGLQQPIYRIESFQDYSNRVVDIESGFVLNSYRSDGFILYSRFAKYWASNHPETPEYSIISGVGKEGPIDFHKSDILVEGELFFISEMGEQYLTIYSSQTLNCFSLSGQLLWSFRYSYGDISSDEMFLSSDESILVINNPGKRVIAIDMNTGRKKWQRDGRYSATSVPFQLSPLTVLFDQLFESALILDRNGQQLFDLNKWQNIQREFFINDKQLVTDNLVIPNLRYEENRVILPKRLASNRSFKPVTPTRWSTKGKYSASVFAYLKNVEPPDSVALEEYRIDIVSADGKSMGFFYPRIRSKLDHSKINVQVSNDGTKILLIGKQE
ncbi:MAG: hypothetical protein L3J79_04665, partial [Candidatus Marinimicrobia bacterium]|nr:hypothetical protein [Candidatus Neomarinimicrobiota bacterium]